MDNLFLGEISCNQTTGWVGLGLNGDFFSTSSVPTNSGDWIIGATANFSGFDQYMALNSLGPVSDLTVGGVNNVQGTLISTPAGALVLRFRRLLDTGDKFDQIILTNSLMRVSGACSNDGVVALANRSVSGRAAQVQSATVSINFGSGLVTTFDNRMILAHAIVMCIAFGIAFALGVAIGRYVPRRIAFWWFLHVAASGAGVALFIAGKKKKKNKNKNKNQKPKTKNQKPENPSLKLCFRFFSKMFLQVLLLRPFPLDGLDFPNGVCSHFPRALMLFLV